MRTGFKDYAIVIGIDSYAQNGEDGFGILTASVAGAARFIEWLKSPSGGNIPEERIVPILSPATVNDQLPSPADARPIKDQIDDALNGFGASRSTKKIGDRLYFYFSGHGIGINSREVAMMMANAMQSMESRNVGLWPYREYFQERHLFDEVVFIADCCRDRVHRVEAGRPVFTSAAHPTPNVLDVTYLAARYKNKSYAITGGQGLLTQALLEGLNGAPGAVDQLGRVTSNTLGEYLKKRVKDLAKQNLLAQEPEVDPEPKNAEIIFAHTGATVPVRIIAAAGVAGPIEISDGSGKVLHKGTAATARAAAPWVVNLNITSIPYIVRMPGTARPPMLLEIETVRGNNNEFHIL